MGRPNENTLTLLNPEALDHDLAELVLRKMSWSRYDCYQWCPAQYMYKYVEFQKEGFSAPLALGSAVHDALEKVVINKVTEQIEVDGWYQEALSEHDPNKLLTQAEIDSGYDWLCDTAARIHDVVGDDYERVIDVEWGFKYIIGAGLFTGYVDLVFWDEDEHGRFVHIVDYKTGNNHKTDKRTGKVTKKKSTKNHGQTKLYTLAAKSRFPGERVKASLYWTKHEEWDTHEYTDKQLKDFERKMRRDLATIFEDSRFRPTSDGIKCAYCDFARDDLCRYGVKQAKKFAAIANARNRRQKKG